MVKRINAKSGVKGFKSETVDGVFTAKIRQMHGYSWVPWMIIGTIIAPIAVAFVRVLRVMMPYYQQGEAFNPVGFSKATFFIALPTFESVLAIIGGGVLGVVIALFRPQRFKLTIDDEYLTFCGKSYALADIGRVRVHRHKGGAFCYVWADYGRREMNLKVWRFFHDASKLQELISSEIEKRTKRDVAINNDDLEMQQRAAAF